MPVLNGTAMRWSLAMMKTPKKGMCPIPILPALVSENDTAFYAVRDVPHGKVIQAAYINTEGTEPQLTCYGSRGDGKGAMKQTGFMREGDLVVRKIVDQNNNKECLVTYVSTEGTSSNIYCYEKQ